jgi:hypothetical protein
LKHHRTFSGGSRQPSTYFNAWTHRLFCLGSSGPTEASIKIRI